MKIIIKGFSIYLLIVIYLSGCSFEEKQDIPDKNNNEYKLYVNNGGNLEILKILNDNNELINITKTDGVNFKENGNILHSLANVGNGNILGSFYDRVGGNLNNKIVSISNEKVTKEVTLKNSGPSRIISDPIRNRAYILSAILPGVYKNGIPLDAINTSSGTVTGSFDIKGALLNYGIYKDKLYLTVVKANDLGYQVVPNNYILQIDLASGKQKILTPDGFNYSPKGMSISNEGTIYIIKMPLDPKEFRKSSLLGYNLDGKIISEYPLTSGGRDLVIDEKGFAYITHNDKEIYADRKGTTISIINTKTGDNVGSIEGLYSPTELEMSGNLLYVINDLNSTISVINKEEGKIIKNILFGKEAVLSSMVIIPVEK